MKRPSPVQEAQKTACSLAEHMVGLKMFGHVGLWRSLVSALDWGSRGRGFKSRQPDQIKRA